MHAISLSASYHATQRAVERGLQLPRALRHGTFAIKAKRPGRGSGDVLLTISVAGITMVLLFQAGRSSSATVVSIWAKEDV